MPTPWQKFVDKWKDCQACPLHETRRHIVLGRGTVPSQLVFVGEAPGASEDVLGLPFVGPAGKLLDRVMERAFAQVGRVPTFSIVNLLCCFPRGEDGKKSRKPADQEVRACSPRLVEFMALADPRLIVCVGVDARDWLDDKTPFHVPIHRLCGVCGAQRPRIKREGEGRPFRAGGPEFASCPRGHKGEAIPVPQVHLDHPAAILRAPEAGQSLMVQRCRVRLADAIEEHLK